MLYDMLNDALDFDSAVINKVYDDLCDVFKSDLCMTDYIKAEESNVLDAFKEELKDFNPFLCSYGNHFYSYPTYAFIAMMYEVATKFIKEKYPEADISYRIYGINSSFSVDDATCEKAREAYEKAREEEEE